MKDETERKPEVLDIHAHLGRMPLFLLGSSNQSRSARAKKSVLSEPTNPRERLAALLSDYNRKYSNSKLFRGLD